MKQPANRCVNRRRFLQRAVAVSGTIVAPYFVPSSALGKDGAVAPSERITLGFIGVGRMGRGHLRRASYYDDIHVVAACDVDQWRREDAKTTVEQGYAAKQASGTYRGCHAYNDLRDLVARDDIDAVVVATGDRWHAAASIMAVKAGKDVYCEKPISLTIREARAMEQAARRYGRVFQIGLQQRSTPEFIKACRLVQDGAIGKVSHVYIAFPGTSSDVNLPVEPVPKGLDWDLWLGPSPWRPFNSRFHIYGNPPRVVPWHFCRDFGGGNLTSNAVHSFDVVQWGLGMDQSGPVEIIPPETGQVPSLTYKYPGGAILQVVDWHLDPKKHFVPEGWDVKTRLQNFGALFIGEGGWIHVGRQGYLTSFPAAVLEQSDGGADPRGPVSNHHQNWVECIKSRELSACDVAVGARSTIVAHLGCIAHWTGRPLKWDPVAEKFSGDEEANRLRGRAKRGPWRI